MERAGAGLALTVDRLVPRGLVAIVCGKGNNGGDGFVAGRLLRGMGRQVRVLTLAEPGRAPRRRGREPAAAGGRARAVRRAALDDAAVIVDAILGTGFQGEPRGPAADAIEAIAVLEAPVVAADVASGVDASTGEAAAPPCARPRPRRSPPPRPAHWIAPGKQLTGELRVIDISIPVRDAPTAAGTGLISARVHELVPGRDAAGTKFTSGHVVVAGGSRGLTGAPCLASEAAMRAGAGYVTALVPRSLEVDLRDTPAGGHDARPARRRRRADARRRRAAIEAAARAGALVLGPGLGRSAAASSSRARSRRARRRAAARRRRAQRARRPARRSRRARRADAADTARGRACAPAGRSSARSRPGACAARARRRSARTRSSCSRATTRSSPRPTVAPRQRPRRAGAGHGGHRRRPQRRHRRAAGEGPRSVRGGLRRRAPPRGGRPRRRRDARRRRRHRERRHRRAAALARRRAGEPRPA